MSAIASPVRSGPAAPAADGATWVHDPWRETPRSAVLGVVSALALCALTLAAHLPFLLSAALCLAIVATLEFAFVPYACRVDAEGCAVKGPLGPRVLAWRQVRRAQPVPAGVRLMTTASPHPLDSVRSLLLPMPRARAGELRALVERLRGGAGA